jgi:hypothetical protein
MVGEAHSKSEPVQILSHAISLPFDVLDHARVKS